MAENKFCNINAKLLPIKSHYFFFFGAMGGVIPFMPVLAKGLGINATAVGLVYTVLPFCVFFSKPLFGYLTDYFRNIKLIVLVLVSVTSAAYLSVLFIPTLRSTAWTDVQLECDSDWLSVTPENCDHRCLRDALKQAADCELEYRACDADRSVTLFGRTTVENGSDSSRANNNASTVLRFEPAVENFTCGCVAEANVSVFRCARPDVNSCFATDDRSVYGSFQFWLFTLLVVVAGTGAATVFCLSDAACYEVLGDRPEHFGRQRLWATINWGFATLLAGFLNDAATGDGSTTYAPGFYLMLALVVVDLGLLLKIKLTKANFSINICKDIGKIFASCETVGFAVAVYIVGGLTGLIWNYQFWFLQDLGASQTLLGLTVAVQCLAAEVPFFFFAGWFIKKFGYFYCLTGSFTCFTVRLSLYYFLQDPWMVLPIEVLHGPTYAVFYASMTGYASDNAPPGTEATMMGILGGLFEGLGVATGSLLGGLGFDKLGGRNTFLVAGGISLICVPTFAITHIVLRKLIPKTAESNARQEEKTNSDTVKP